MRTWLAYVRSGTIAGWNPLAVRHALGSFVNQRTQHPSRAASSTEFCNAAAAARARMIVVGASVAV